MTVYVGDDSGAATSARQALAAAGDPNRPVVVMQATQIAVALIITLLITPGMDPAIVSAGVIAALTDNKVGLFGSWNMCDRPDRVRQPDRGGCAGRARGGGDHRPELHRQWRD